MERRAPKWMDSVDDLSDTARFAAMTPNERLESMLRDAISKLQPGATIGTDTFLAAFARAAKLSLVTFDRGFRRFSGIRIVTPT